ncbi:hypothetical protein ACX9MO_06130 [Pseudooceanicola sp. 502str34]
MQGSQSGKHTSIIKVPEAVGVFDSFEALQQAYYDLTMVGFSRHDISLLGSESALREKLGDRFWHSKDLEDDPTAPRASKERENLAIKILEGHSGRDVHVHDWST